MRDHELCPYVAAAIVTMLEMREEGGRENEKERQKQRRKEGRERREEKRREREGGGGGRGRGRRREVGRERREVKRESKLIAVIFSILWCVDRSSLCVGVGVCNNCPNQIRVYRPSTAHKHYHSGINW